MEKSKFAVAVGGLVMSKLACAGAVPVGISVGSALGVPVGTAIAQATGLPIESIGGGVMFAVATTALVVGVQIVRRKQGR